MSRQFFCCEGGEWEQIAKAASPKPVVVIGLIANGVALIILQFDGHWQQRYIDSAVC